MPFAARMNLEIITLSEVRQRQISYMWNQKKMIQMNLFTKQNRRTDIENLELPKGRVGGG